MKQKSIYALGKTVKGTGKITFNNQQIFVEELKGLDGDIVITVTEGRRKRSIAQNSYYWGKVIQMISDYTGDEPDNVHDFFKGRFLTDKRMIVIADEEIEAEKASTTRLTTKGMDEYMEKIRRFAAEKLNLNIPEPNE
jgi:hypothetical protein